jgi:hypothetical protein
MRKYMAFVCQSRLPIIASADGSNCSIVQSFLAKNSGLFNCAITFLSKDRELHVIGKKQNWQLK